MTHDSTMPGDRGLGDPCFDDPHFRDPRFAALCQILLDLKTVVVAYSGGVDSAFLLRVARAFLGDRAIAVLAVSESLDRAELEAARRTAEAMRVPIEIVETHEYDNPDYRRNDGTRCYHCKKELFGVIRSFAESRGIPHVLDGSNADDAQDYRPGMQALGELGVRSPLREAGLDKATVRELSRALGLSTWDKPAAPCLSSRIPHGEEVTEEKLRQVEAAEEGLRALGFRVCRVRHHGQVARIEVPAADLARMLEPAVRPAAVAAVKKAGFPFVALDLEGFRSGSLNEALGRGGAGAAASAAGSPFVPMEAIAKARRGGGEDLAQDGKKGAADQRPAADSSSRTTRQTKVG